MLTLKLEIDGKIKEFKQKSIKVRAMREMMKFQARMEKVESGEVMHTNNPLLNRAAYNAMIKEYNDSVAIDKQINRNKIDSLDAIINAMSDAQLVFWDMSYLD